MNRDEIVGSIFIFFVCYLLGSIPAGYLLGKIKGLDIRKQGSGNIGFTNVYRIMGKTYGIITFIVDFLKGYLAVILTPYLCQMFDMAASSGIKTLAGLGAIIGHNWTFILRFKGGKGVLTSTGVFFALAPLETTLTLCAFLITVFRTHYISMGSLVSAVLLPFLTWSLSAPFPVVWLSIAAGASIFYKHLPNIKRLKAGTENSFSLFKKKQQKN